MTREDKVKLNREQYKEIAEFMDLMRICFKNAHVTKLIEGKHLTLRKYLPILRSYNFILIKGKCNGTQ